ncbi:MAG: terminase large subunit domain-containing protein, partial [Planctomycetota bacterium]
VHFVAGRQSGKTEAGAGELSKQTHLAPRFLKQDYMIAAPTYDKTLAARFRFQEMLPFGSWRFQASEKRYIVQGHGGATTNVWIRNADEDAPRSLTLDGAWIDEAAFCPEGFFDNLRPALATRDGVMFTTSTPFGRNHHFQMYTPATDQVGVVFAESRDNPAFSEAQWQAAVKRYGYDSPFFQQEYRGIAAAFVGQAVPKFADGLVRDAAWHPDWQVVVGMDFGFTAGTVALLAQISPDEDIVIHGLRYWTNTARSIITASLVWPWCDNVRPVYCIDPSGTSGRAPETGDIGWQSALENMQLRHDGGTAIDVRWNRMIGESAGLNIIRQLAERGKVIVASTAIAEVMGGKWEGAYEVERLLQGAMLKPGHDKLDESHPEADVMDSLRYICAVMLPHWQATVPSVSRFDA